MKRHRSITRRGTGHLFPDGQKLKPYRTHDDAHAIEDGWPRRISLKHWPDDNALVEARPVPDRAALKLASASGILHGINALHHEYARGNIRIVRRIIKVSI
jgi:hypothetical protein